MFRVKGFVKHNIPLILAVTVFAATFLINQNVAAYGDDYGYYCLRRSKLSESYRDCLSTNCRIQCLGELPRKEKDPGDRFPEVPKIMVIVSCYTSTWDRNRHFFW